MLIFGGSQAVQRFDSAVEQALPELAARAIVVHVTGESAYAAALARREALPAPLRERYRPCNPFPARRWRTRSPRPTWW